MRFPTSSIILALSLILVGTASAQIDTATITGTVHDPSGAIVAGAQVTVTNTATNFSSTAVTNSEGLYRVQSLRPGAYKVEIAAAGFRRFIQDGIEVRGGDVAAINGKMEI